MDTEDVYRRIHEVGIPIVIGLTEATKQALPCIPARYAPAIAIFWGIVLLVASAYLSGARLDAAVLDGAMAGLLASGLVKVSQLVADQRRGDPKA